jgi:hypothetical protein
VSEHGGERGRDTRRRRRVPCDLPATVGPRRAAAGRVVDVSLAGCLLRSEAPLGAGEFIDLQLELPDGPMRVKARVVDVSQDGDAPPGQSRSLAGLEFLGLAAADEPRLRGFIESGRSAGADKASS